jgi:hypothetical protein
MNASIFTGQTVSDFSWQASSKAQRIGKIPGASKIEAFSLVAGAKRYVAKTTFSTLSTENQYWTSTTSLSHPTGEDFTFEFRMKLDRSSPMYITPFCLVFGAGGNFLSVNKSLNTLVVSLSGYTYITTNVITLPDSIYGEWHTWSFAIDRNNEGAGIGTARCYFYIDGILYATLFFDTGTRVSIANLSIVLGGFNIDLDFIRLLNNLVSASDILANYTSIKDTYTGYTIAAQFIFDEQTGRTAAGTTEFSGDTAVIDCRDESLTLQLIPSWYSESYPLNASIHLGSFPISTPNKHTVRFPWVKPTDVTFVPVLSWVDDYGVAHKGKLWWDVGEVIFGVGNYNGEILPVDYTLEIWSIPGVENAVNLAAIYLVLSLLFETQSMTAKDLYYKVLETPTLNTSIAMAFPATFPLTFAVARDFIDT